MLNPTLPSFDEPEGDPLPFGRPRVIDAHVDIFPDCFFSMAAADYFQFKQPVSLQDYRPDRIVIFVDYPDNPIPQNLQAI